MARAVDEAVLKGLTDDERRAVIAAAGRFARAEVVLSNIAIVGVGGFAAAMLTVFAVLPLRRMSWDAADGFAVSPVTLAIATGAVWLALIVLGAVAASRSIRRRAVMRAIGSHARRAVCIRCGYSLVGLGRLEPTDAQAARGRSSIADPVRIKLSCPECGLACPVSRFAGVIARAERA